MYIDLLYHYRQATMSIMLIQENSESAVFIYVPICYRKKWSRSSNAKAK